MGISNLILLLTFSLSAIACEHGFFPQSEILSNFDMEKGIKTTSRINFIIKELKDLYNPLLKKQEKKLIIDILWDEPKINAFATRDDSNNPVIKLSAGLIQNPTLSDDGLRLVLCHEVGHFLGGSPKKLRGRSQKKSWSSAEGQADYYANAYCMKTLLSDQNNKNILEIDNQTDLQEVCSDSICKRIALASINVAKVYAKIDFYSSELSLLKPDNTVVYRTIYSHPNPQCRLDTLIAALKCKDSTELTFSDNDPLGSACLDPQFRRPRCWYYPEIN